MCTCLYTRQNPSGDVWGSQLALPSVGALIKKKASEHADGERRERCAGLHATRRLRIAGPDLPSAVGVGMLREKKGIEKKKGILALDRWGELTFHLLFVSLSVAVMFGRGRPSARLPPFLKKSRSVPTASVEGPCATRRYPATVSFFKKKFISEPADGDRRGLRSGTPS